MVGGEMNFKLIAERFKSRLRLEFSLNTFALLGSRPTLAILASAFFGVSVAVAAPITVNGLYEFLDNRGPNEVGIGSGVFVQFGAGMVTPSGADGTTGIATRDLQTRNLIPENFTVNPNFFVGSRADTGDQVSRGSWSLGFSNGADTTTANTLLTPSIPNTFAPLPFVSNVALSGTGLAPTVSWQSTAGIDAITVRVRDLGQNANLGGGFTANVI